MLLFGNKFPDDPLSVIYTICSLMDYWGGLQTIAVQDIVHQGSRQLHLITVEAFNRLNGWVQARL